MKIVYLDQNKWISVAKVSLGRETDPGLCKAVEFMRVAHEQRLHVYPLSLSHYLNTIKRQNPTQRKELALAMIEFSQFDTLANPRAIVRAELDWALRWRFPDTVNPRPYSLLAKGVAHASDGVWSPWPDDSGSPLPPEVKEKWDTDSRLASEVRRLAGPDPPGYLDTHLPHFEKCAKQFPVTLRSLVNELKGIATFDQQLFLIGRQLVYVRSAIEESLAHHDLGKHMPDWAGDGQSKVNHTWWAGILDDMPSRRIDMHMCLQYARNHTLPKRDTDLDDFFYVGAAIAHCDVVVTENQLADLANRSKFDMKAQVITSLSDLPRF